MTSSNSALTDKKSIFRSFEGLEKSGKKKANVAIGSPLVDVALFNRWRTIFAREPALVEALEEHVNNDRSCNRSSIRRFITFLREARKISVYSYEEHRWLFDKLIVERNFGNSYFDDEDSDYKVDWGTLNDRITAIQGELSVFDEELNTIKGQKAADGEFNEMAALGDLLRIRGHQLIILLQVVDAAVEYAFSEVKPSIEG